MHTKIPLNLFFLNLHFIEKSSRECIKRWKNWWQNPFDSFLLIKNVSFLIATVCGRIVLVWYRFRVIETNNKRMAKVIINRGYTVHFWIKSTITYFYWTIWHCKKNSMVLVLGIKTIPTNLLWLLTTKQLKFKISLFEVNLFCTVHLAKGQWPLLVIWKDIKFTLHAETNHV